MHLFWQTVCLLYNINNGYVSTAINRQIYLPHSFHSLFISRYHNHLFLCRLQAIPDANATRWIIGPFFKRLRLSFLILSKKNGTFYSHIFCRVFPDFSEVFRSNYTAPHSYTFTYFYSNVQELRIFYSNFFRPKSLLKFINIILKMNITRKKIWTRHLDKKIQSS